MHMKIGELAKRAGLTVRTLHHYDTIGLLPPSARSGSGFRLYNQADVVRLHRILTLRQFGCSLSDIGAFLAEPGASPLGIITKQIASLDAQVQRAQALLERLRLLRGRIASGADTGLADWLVVLEMMSMYERHFTKAELAALHSRKDSAGQDLNEQWRGLIAEVQTAMDSGLLSESEEARDLAWKWMRLVSKMTGNDAVLAGKLRAIFEQEARAREITGITPGMIQWISRACAHTRSASLSKPTALRVATLRAAHQLLDDPLVFKDPFALRILGAEGERSLRDNLTQYNTPLFRGLRTSVTVRSRLAEDEWTLSQRRGIRQYVILGAGLDTLAYRTPDRDGSRIFEVDLPTTQQWKRDCLRAAGISEPASLTFVPVDFERSTLAEELDSAGFLHNEPAFFSWLGVTMYLEEEAVMNVLRFIATLAPGSSVVFDYAVLPALLSPRERKGLELVSAKTAEHGEPMKTFFNPELLAGTLRSLGFSEVEDFTPERLNERYLSERGDGLRKSGVSRLILARV